MRLLVACLLAPAAQGHGSMNTPPTRNNGGQTRLERDSSCMGDGCYWYQVGCFNGCGACSSEGKSFYPQPTCASPMEPTNNDFEARTINREGKSWRGDWTKYLPWRAPGHAPVVDSCGAAGGYLPGVAPYAKVPEGYSAMDKGSEKLPAVEGLRTVWPASGTAEVAWSIAANHGGGYSYRLCPKGQPLTEECFQSHPLRFAPENTTIRFNDGSKAFEVPTVTVTKGTKPAGSQWRRNPIPMCNCDAGLSCGDKAALANSGPVECEHHRELMKGKDDPRTFHPYEQGEPTAHCPTGTQFPAPFFEIGDGVLVSQPNEWSIVDKVEVPNTPGEYVLSWRWDAESADQVWTNCADITISATEPPSPGPRPAPPGPPGPSAPGYMCTKWGCFKKPLGTMSQEKCEASCGKGDIVI